MSLPAIECVRRGAYNARANWELVLAQWLGVVATVVLTIASLLPVVLLLGLAGITSFRTPAEAGEWFTDWLQRAVGELFAFSAPMLLALVAVAAIGTLAMIVYCFFQAGIFGVLVAGDRQAPAGPPGDWRLFRTWSGDHFRGWGARHVWRFFWFFNLVLLVATLALALWALLLGAVAVGARSMGPGAAFAIGCGSVLPLILFFLVLALWVWVAQAELASEGSSVGLAARRALRIAGRRLGGLLLIAVLGIVASVALGAVFLPLSVLVDLVFRDSFATGIVLRAVLALVQWGASGIVHVALAGALVALVRDEIRAEGREVGA